MTKKPFLMAIMLAAVIGAYTCGRFNATLDNRDAVQERDVAQYSLAVMSDKYDKLKDIDKEISNSCDEMILRIVKEKFTCSEAAESGGGVR